MRVYEERSLDKFWKQVVSKIGGSAELHKKRWIQIKEKFRYEKKKKESSWECFDALGFPNEGIALKTITLEENLVSHISII